MSSSRSKIRRNLTYECCREANKILEMVKLKYRYTNTVRIYAKYWS